MMPSTVAASLLYLLILVVGPTSVQQIIAIKSPNLFPESFKWDPLSHCFIVASFRHASLHSVSDSGLIHPLISDPHLPPNVSILGITIDTVHRRLLTVIHAAHPFPPFNALAAYDLSRRPHHPRIFLTQLPDPTNHDHPIANDVTVDASGNAYVTNSASNFVWKVDIDGQYSIFSNSSVFRGHHVYADKPGNWCGLNGIAYLSNGGYLLAVQSNTGKMYKIDGVDGAAQLVWLPKDLTGADGMAITSDGDVVVVSHHTAWFLKSADGWVEGEVYDEIALEVEKFATAVAVREGKRVYVLYGHMDEGLLGNVDRTEFSIEEIESEGEKEREGDKVWVFVLIALGLAYFLFWRYQMGQLGRNMNKKRA